MTTRIGSYTEAQCAQCNTVKSLDVLQPFYNVGASFQRQLFLCQSCIDRLPSAITLTPTEGSSNTRHIIVHGLSEARPAVLSAKIYTGVMALVVTLVGSALVYLCIENSRVS